MISSTSGFSQSRYLRLIAIFSVEVFATVPLVIVYMVLDLKMGFEPWKSWADTHRHYSVVDQVPGSAWKNVPEMAMCLEIYRWSLVACAFIFFALFGFAAEAREHYYRLYRSLARRIGTSLSAPHGAPHAYALCCPILIHRGSYSFSFFFCSTPSSVSYVKRNDGVTGPIMVQPGRDRDSLSTTLTLTDQPSVLSISTDSLRNSDPTAVQDSHSDIVSFYSAKSFDEPASEIQDECQSAPLPGILLTARPGSDQLHFSDATGSTIPVHASSSVETV